MISFSKVYTVNRQTTLSRIVCSLRNNKICPSQGNGKKIIYFLYNSSWGDDTLVVSFQIMLMKGSYATTFIAYIRSHPN